MPICNPFDKDAIKRIVADLDAEEERMRASAPKKANTTDEFISFMERGMEKIENSPTKHLMFATDDGEE